jgi:demethylmenaquinone methyltransferase / 2-methoxy-6-polyprenyl-1,4-benzoquinol methylase
MSYKSQRILDVATGTADFAIQAASLDPDLIIGIDISQNMLQIGEKKIIKFKLEKIIKLELGEAENLKFNSGSFDAVTVAFGVRNFENLEHGLLEIYRVIRDGGVSLILEFSKPNNLFIKQIYKLYSRYFIPLFGRIISNNRVAYEYLPSTISEFPDGENFCKVLQSVGFKKTFCYPQTFGIASIYLAIKE